MNKRLIFIHKWNNACICGENTVSLYCKFDMRIVQIFFESFYKKCNKIYK